MCVCVSQKICMLTASDRSYSHGFYAYSYCLLPTVRPAPVTISRSAISHTLVSIIKRHAKACVRAFVYVL